MTPASPDDIARRLREARAAYYDSDTPLMSDREFDALEDELRSVDPGNDYFSTVGYLESADSGTGDRSSKKIRHRVPMLSMGKAKDLAEAEKWLRRLGPEKNWALTVQPKIDGLSASLYYQKGELVYVATRGDGEQGQDISHVAEFMEDIPESISFTSDPIEVRGELHLPKDTTFDTGGRPLRNNCVGLINRKEDRADLKYVRFLAYQIVWPESGHLSSGATAAPESLAQEPRFHSESGKIDLLGDSGFTTFNTWLLTSEGTADDANSPVGELFAGAEGAEAVVSDFMKGLEEIYRKYIDELREAWNFETDGLIVVVDDNRLHDAIDERWVVDHHHHYALAFKPPSQAARTSLLDVVWQVSRQGNLTPVAQFEPVQMGGAVLERASLHNADNVRRLKLAVGDSILVERANDVIPYVRDNPDGADREDGFRDENLWPQVCPSCASIPVESGVNIACPNPECRNRVLQSILYWVRQADMEQVALKTLESLYDAGKLRRIRDLYTLGEADFEGLEGFGEKKISNFLAQVAASKTMSPTAFIARLGIPMVQKKSLSRLGIATMEDFLGFEDESYVIGQRIVEWKREAGNLDYVRQLLEVVSLEAGPGEGERKGVVCLTGKAPVPRKTLVTALENLGWTVAGAVTKETVKLVCDDPGGSSTKLKKARDSGIPIVTYDEFIAEEGIDL